MADLEKDKCDFCHEIKSVERTYLKPSNYTKSLNNSRLKLYNEGDYFIVIKTCFDCGIPKNETVKYLGWDCPTSPTKVCNYRQEDGSYDEDSCIYCGEPEERK